MIFVTILIMYIVTVLFLVNENGNWNAQQVIKTALFIFPAVAVALAKASYWVINTLLKSDYKNTYIDLALDSIKREIQP
ncbi:hypothetical protein My1_029 [Pectobacterium phage My1]|uniref:Uncharacterized protein n=1 Tax=Pectobacterium phage My1 TaxID=1204539 RepID=J9QM57_9CAUD|nr:hypothetical protein My1_029 [Pectobacterium phage My1]AFQ22188.1 hypothetical protein My1_029 [Pectobacterium phage My1]